MNGCRLSGATVIRCTLDHPNLRKGVNRAPSSSLLIREADGFGLIQAKHMSAARRGQLLKYREGGDESVIRSATAVIALATTLLLGCGTAPSFERAMSGTESEAPSPQAKREKPVPAPYRGRAGSVEIEVALATQPTLAAERFGPGDALVAGVLGALSPPALFYTWGLSVFSLPFFAVASADWGGSLDRVDQELAPQAFLASVGAVLEKRMRQHLGSDSGPQKLTVTIDYYGLIAQGEQPSLSTRDAPVCFVGSARAYLEHRGRADREVTVSISPPEVRCASIREFLADDCKLLRFASRDAAALVAAKVDRQLREQP